MFSSLVKYKWTEAAKPLERAPGCTCTHTLGGMATILALQGAPAAALPGAQCPCGRMLVQINTKRTFHRNG